MPNQPKPVSVEHLTNSLAQIELWVRACRLALSKLDKNMEIKLSPPELQVWQGPNAPLKTAKDCPPPE